MPTYSVKARRIGEHSSVATTKAAEMALDTSVGGQEGAFNPAELLLTSIAACMIKGIERLAPLLEFNLRGVVVKVSGVRQDSPPKIVSIDYEIIVDTGEDDHRLDLLHGNVRKYGTISNTIAEVAIMTGILRRKEPTSSEDVKEHQTELDRVAEFSRQRLDAIPAPGTDLLHEGP